MTSPDSDGFPFVETARGLRRLMLIVLAAIFLSPLAFTQQPEYGSLEGIIVRLGTEAPLGDATISLIVVRSDGFSPVLSRREPVRTSSDGRFLFENLEEGRYRIQVTRSGYLPARYGQYGPNGPGSEVFVPAGSAVRDVRITMTPGGAISGRVVDEFGDPVRHAQVQALRWSYAEGARYLNHVATAVADDRGEYSLFWLAPGAYYVRAVPTDPEAASIPASIPSTPVLSAAQTALSTGSLALTVSSPNAIGRVVPTFVRPAVDGSWEEVTWMPGFYPSALSAADAAPVEVRAGAETSRVDITMSAARVYTIRGVVMNAVTEAPQANTILLGLAPRNSAFAPTPVQIPLNWRSGTFEIRLPEGDYWLTARIDRPAAAAVVPIAVRGADLDNVRVTVAPGFEVAGRVSFQGPAPDDDLSGWVVTLQRDDRVQGPISSSLNAPAVFTGEDGSFTMANVAPGSYWISVRKIGAREFAPAPLSMRLDGEDGVRSAVPIHAQPSTPLDIVLDARRSTVQGAVYDNRRGPVAGATVVLVPDVPLRNRSAYYRTAVTDVDGRFEIVDAAVGNWQIFAWEDVENGAWQYPDFLRRYETQGRMVRVSGGDAVSVDVTVIPVER